MIQAKDLRIGNIVYFDFSHDEEKIITEIVGIYESGDISVIKNKVKIYECSEDSIYPIPLTEEWLLKFGFVKRKNKHKIHWENKIKISQYVDEKYNFFSIVTGFDIRFSPELEHVHQLQNLYFALTNKELNYEN